MGFWTDLGSVATGAIERDREKTKATLDDRKDELKGQASHGTRAGQWSARKAQALAKAYKKAGGGYK